MTILLVTLALALLVGVSVGLLGGGGSILAVPILVYVAGLDPKVAIATSLVVVGATAAAGAIPHALAGRVQWRTAAIFGVTGMVGAYGGGRAAAFVPGEWLLAAFGVMMAVTAVAMLGGGRRPSTEPRTGPLPLGHIVVEGLVIGAVTGLVGAGGGFLVVPALVLLGGVPMATAVGTSLVVIAVKSGAGLLGYLSSTSVDWRLAAAFTAAAIVGSLGGGRLAGRVPDETLRRAFGWFVLAMGVVMIMQQFLP
ncbi:sulfite exporter TauE/SafE family protein [Nitriliruptor alkaliphilus]|uniref:sulfite exporter TauE/SafE family protein n=1 Tax=Nitriliruptor alkaliphilus TaxID=427918 RepID=UPI0006985FDA|nr:sulfite exporter TauE/SafE family protein [Nitriliruptor alkaliphilus]